MTDYELQNLLDNLVKLPKETEWVEFKVNNDNPQEIGQYVSAISNSSCIANREFGYIVWGVDDKTHKIIGTTFNPKVSKKGNEELENWLSRFT